MQIVVNKVELTSWDDPETMDGSVRVEFQDAKTGRQFCQMEFEMANGLIVGDGGKPWDIPRAGDTMSLTGLLEQF